MLDHVCSHLQNWAAWHTGRHFRVWGVSHGNGYLCFSVVMLGRDTVAALSRDAHRLGAAFDEPAEAFAHPTTENGAEIYIGRPPVVAQIRAELRPSIVAQQNHETP